MLEYLAFGAIAGAIALVVYFAINLGPLVFLDWRINRRVRKIGCFQGTMRDAPTRMRDLETLVYGNSIVNWEDYVRPVQRTKSGAQS